jgi:uncharacterized membrane protein
VAETTQRPDDERRRLAPAGILLGLGLGGFVDGILLHQVLQWHHLLTNRPEDAAYPDTTVASLEQNTLADGLFHAGTWVFTVAGLYLLWRATSTGHRFTTRGLTGLLLSGWGLFNLVEGIVNHHLLSIHRVRDDVADPLWWDLGFLAFGALLVVVGWALWRSDGTRPARSGSDLRRTAA